MGQLMVNAWVSRKCILRLLKSSVTLRTYYDGSTILRVLACACVAYNRSGQAEQPPSNAEHRKLIAASWQLLQASYRWHLYSIARILGTLVPRLIPSVLPTDMARVHSHKICGIVVSNFQAYPDMSCTVGQVGCQGSGIAEGVLPCRFFGHMEHGLHASNAHRDPLTRDDGPPSAAPAPLPSSSADPPASTSKSDPLADAGRAPHFPALHHALRKFLLCYREFHSLSLTRTSLNACMTPRRCSTMSLFAGSQQAPSGSSPSHRTRLRRFEQELAASPISMKQLRRLAFHGIPEKEGLRATTWKVQAVVPLLHCCSTLFQERWSGRKNIILHPCQESVHALHCRLCIRGMMARCPCLQILLNYLPPDRRQWKGLLEQKRAAYQQFKQELIIDPKKQEQSAAADHPLSQSSDSRWNAYFKVSMGACSVTVPDIPFVHTS